MGLGRARTGAWGGQASPSLCPCPQESWKSWISTGGWAGRTGTLSPSQVSAQLPGLPLYVLETLLCRPGSPLCTLGLSPCVLGPPLCPQMSPPCTPMPCPSSPGPCSCNMGHLPAPLCHLPVCQHHLPASQCHHFTRQGHLPPPWCHFPAPHCTLDYLPAPKCHLLCDPRAATLTSGPPSYSQVPPPCSLLSPSCTPVPPCASPCVPSPQRSPRSRSPRPWTTTSSWSGRTTRTVRCWGVDGGPWPAGRDGGGVLPCLSPQSQCHPLCPQSSTSGGSRSLPSPPAGGDPSGSGPSLRRHVCGRMGTWGAGTAQGEVGGQSPALGTQGSSILWQPGAGVGMGTA